MMRRYLSYAAVLAMVLAAFSGTARAQGRINDRDLARLMQNVRDDAQPFRQNFARALKKSMIRKTSRERDARDLGDRFASESKRALDAFKDKSQADSQVTEMVDTAGKIDQLVYSLSLGPSVTSEWEKLRTELHQVAQAFGVREPYFESQPPSGSAMGAEAGDTRSCVVSAGPARSRQLVSECKQVSPATHPPCDAQNACALIVDEIRRGCALIGQGAPSFCAEYR